MIRLMLAQESAPFLGQDLLPWLLLAFGAAMVVGNLAAILKPPAPRPDDPPEAPNTSMGRPLALVVIGAVAAIWALASLLTG